MSNIWGALQIDVSHIFRNCVNLDGNIPENLFANNEKIIHFSYAFYQCKKLTGNAPKLWERENVESYANCFYNCVKMNNYYDIPKNWGGKGS